MLLVTGASGFLGRNLTLEALAAACHVVGVVHEQPVDDVAIESVTADLTRPSAAKALLERLRPATVVNCAAFADVDACEANTELGCITLTRKRGKPCEKLSIRSSPSRIFQGAHQVPL